MKRLLSLTGLGFLLAAMFLVAQPVRAGDVDQRIRTLEDELGRLKGEQMELKKEATAATAALPNFLYRPGDGVWVEAGDRSWSFNITYELEVASYNIIHGDPHKGAPHGDIFFRRNRPYLRFCLNDCFYAYTIGWDMDNNDLVNPSVNACTTVTSATTCTTTAVRSNRAAIQNQGFVVHFEKINPFLPRFEIGDAIGSYTGTMGFSGVKGGNQGTITDEQITDLLSDSGANELSRRAVSLSWVQKPIGLGDISWDIEYKPSVSENDSNTGTLNQATTDRRAFQTALVLRPFSRSKRSWLEDLTYSIGLQTDAIDTRSGGNLSATNTPTTAFTTGAKNLSLTSWEREGRVTVFTVPSSATIGSGQHYRFEQGFRWRPNFYQLTLEHGFSKYGSGRANGAVATVRGLKGYYWGVTNDFWVWSPKGFLTGDRGTPGTVLFGWAFQRSNADCGNGGGCITSTNGYSQDYQYVRELGLYYYLWRGARVGVNWTWYQAKNTPPAIQQEIGCSSNQGVLVPAAAAGLKSCDWHAVSVILHTNF